MQKFLIVSLLFFLGNCKPPQKVDYYLPNNYEGQVAVVFANNGDSVIIKDGRQKVDIPDSGIVFIKQKPFFGQIDYKYYIKDSNGVSETIRYLPGMEKKIGTKYVFFEESVNGTLTGKSGNYIHYNAFHFYVGQQLDSLVEKQRFNFLRHLDSVIADRN